MEKEDYVITLSAYNYKNIISIIMSLVCIWYMYHNFIQQDYINVGIFAIISYLLFDGTKLEITYGELTNVMEAADEYIEDDISN